MAPQSRRGTALHVCGCASVYRDPREKCPDVQKPNVQVSALCNCVLVTEVWPVLCVGGTAEALAGDVNGGFSSL